MKAANGEVDAAIDSEGEGSLSPRAGEVDRARAALRGYGAAALCARDLRQLAQPRARPRGAVREAVPVAAAPPARISRGGVSVLVIKGAYRTARDCAALYCAARACALLYCAGLHASAIYVALTCGCGRGGTSRTGAAPPHSRPIVHPTTPQPSDRPPHTPRVARAVRSTAAVKGSHRVLDLGVQDFGARYENSHPWVRV
eukprot:9502751-Pyramimonas_sp.AAC.1